MREQARFFEPTIAALYRAFGNSSGYYEHIVVTPPPNETSVDIARAAWLA